ncbi:MAG: hypothetical protein LBB90_07630, partial [Tannerella sp.]|nr:hypothetical protein [Tannerella sp.]
GTRRVPGRVFDAYPDGFYKYTACNMDDKTVWRNFDAVALVLFPVPTSHTIVHTDWYTAVL